MRRGGSVVRRHGLRTADNTPHRDNDPMATPERLSKDQIGVSLALLAIPGPLELDPGPRPIDLTLEGHADPVRTGRVVGQVACVAEPRSEGLQLSVGLARPTEQRSPAQDDLKRAWMDLDPDYRVVALVGA